MYQTGGREAEPEAAASEDAWRQFALTTFGGNEVRAAAAARAAVEAQAAGAGPDAALAAAREAYSQPPSPATADIPPASAGAAGFTEVIRPSGGPALAVTLVTAAASGAIAYVARSRDSLFLWMLAVGGAALVVWFGFTLRERVVVGTETVEVRGLLRTVQFQRFDVDRIVVRQSTARSARRWGQRRFTALFVGTDATLASVDQGAWTRSDMDRIAAAIGTHAEDEQAP